MRLIYHPRVQHDVTEALRYYDEVGGAALGDAFFDELCARTEMARAHPERFHFFDARHRRANLRRFPFHFLFRVAGDVVRVLVVRHDRRHPSFGLRRR
jgi:plasmid stabilization system protein ParE